MYDTAIGQHEIIRQVTYVIDMFRVPSIPSFLFNLGRKIL